MVINLYILQCQEFYKVGVSKDFETRIKSISTSNPFEITIVHTIDFDLSQDAKIAEKIAHQQLFDMGLHVKLEWFKGEKDVIIEVCESSARVAKNKERLRSNRMQEKHRHLLKMLRSDIVVDLTQISEKRLAEILDGSNMKSHEIVRMNTLLEKIHG